MMRNHCCKKALVVGIIVLFIGVGVYPAVSSVPIKTTNILQIDELESPVISDSEEDCNCKPVSNLHLVRIERLVNRIVVYNNLLSLLSRHNPEVAEKYQEISDEITALRELTNELKPDTDWEDNPVICMILFIILFVLSNIGMRFLYLSEDFERFPILSNFFYLIYVIFQKMASPYWYLFLEHYECMGPLNNSVLEMK